MKVQAEINKNRDIKIPRSVEEADFEDSGEPPYATLVGFGHFASRLREIIGMRRSELDNYRKKVDGLSESEKRRYNITVREMEKSISDSETELAALEKMEDITIFYITLEGIPCYNIVGRVEKRKLEKEFVDMLVHFYA